MVEGKSYPTGSPELLVELALLLELVDPPAPPAPPELDVLDVEPEPDVADVLVELVELVELVDAPVLDDFVEPPHAAPMSTNDASRSATRAAVYREAMDTSEAGLARARNARADTRRPPVNGLVRETSTGLRVARGDLVRRKISRAPWPAC
jgi:hypothetical protein